MIKKSDNYLEKHRQAAIADVREYVAVYYNAMRLHSTLGYKTPMDYEKGLNKVSDIGWPQQFSASVNGAKASAALYSLIETAKANQLEPYQYLRHIFSEIPKATSPDRIEALLP